MGKVSRRPPGSPLDIESSRPLPGQDGFQLFKNSESVPRVGAGRVFGNALLVVVSVWVTWAFLLGQEMGSLSLKLWLGLHLRGLWQEKGAECLLESWGSGWGSRVHSKPGTADMVAIAQLPPSLEI